MLTNKLLINNGYVFIKDINPSYIRTLIALGSKPIFVCIKDNKRLISVGGQGTQYKFVPYSLWNYIYDGIPSISIDYINLYSLDRLSISEIKAVLSNTIKNIFDYVFFTNVKMLFYLKC